jgi:putative tricarboxylic transport membrane protein
VIGVYTLGNLISDIGIMVFFGAMGFLMKKFDYEPAPLVLAYILGPLFEDNLRRSLNISGGNFSVFFTRPISLTFIMMGILVLIFPTVKNGFKRMAYR